jgi:hypothetical protein
MERHLKIILGALLAVMLLTSFGAFFLLVPVMSLAEVVLILLGLTLMFGLGVLTGGRRIRVSRLREAWRAQKLAH